MAHPDDALDRLAGAAERIADALEYLVRASADVGPRPRLAVARSPTDASGMPAVNLSGDGKLNVHVQNTGDAETTLLETSVKIGEAQFVGGIIGPESRVQSSAVIAASRSGPGLVVQFELGGQAHVLEGLPLTLRLPHRPGRFPDVTVLEVHMEPSGSLQGRAGWRQVGSKESPSTYASA